MKKKVLSILLALVAIATTVRAQVVLNSTNFPDANFRAALAEILEISEGDEITEAKIAATTSLNVSFKKIADLTGIEHFTALELLHCYGNQLISLNVSNNTALTELHCSTNQLTSLDVSKNTALTYLNCCYNQLTSLNVSKNTALTRLDCKGNLLTSLDVSGCTALTRLECNSNLLTSLDVSNNTALTSLNCGGNPLTSLDVSKNTALTELYCNDNQLTSLDVSKNTALTELICPYNQLTSLDVSKNTALTRLLCHNNQLTSLDVSGCTALTRLECYSNQLTSLDVSGCTALRGLECYGNQIKGEAMDALVANLPTGRGGAFYVIDTKDENEGNVCTKAQVAIAKEKGWMVYDYNGGNRPYPEYEGIEAKLLNAENFPDAKFRAALASILKIREGDEITAEKIAATTRLAVSRKSIADLTGIEHFTALTYLDCNGNQLTSLDMSKNTALIGLYCNDNQLTSLDVSKNTALTELGCENNQLTSLDVSKNNALGWLYCYNNQLTSLDVSKNAALTRLFCYSNQIKGEAMDALVASLPPMEGGEFYVINTKDEKERNVCTKPQVAVAKGKGWTVYDYNGSYSNRQEYEGSDDATAKLLLNAENFPDANFRKALTEILGGISEGDEITEAKIAARRMLNVSGKSIADLTGIEHFTALKYLYCDYNQLTALDVSKNSALTDLDCSDNKLTALDVSKNTALTSLDCDYNQLTSLDVSKNTALTLLYCSGNQLTALDVSKNTKLTKLSCSSNQLTSLDVSKNTALKRLECYKNELTSLDVSKNTKLTDLRCYSNQIKGEAMDALVASLPTVSKGSFYVIDTKDENEGNVCTKAQVAIAIGKGWKVYDYNGRNLPYPEYEGSDPVEEDIDPVDEDDNVDFGNDMDENSDLDGNVIGDIFYNIGSGNGEYNAEEGCIVLKKTTDDETVDGLSGKDIFGEDFKGQFTGIVFKVPAGKGTVKVTAETTGNMLLKVKIGDGEPVEMELNGKLKISFPYNVSETTLVAIYAGAANEAKGLGTTNDAEDAALKIYGIEFERDNTTAIGASLNDNGKMTNDNYYSIDGKKLSGEPTKKGIYIRNGRKIVK